MVTGKNAQLEMDELAVSIPLSLQTQRFPLRFSRTESHRLDLAGHVNVLSLPRKMVKMGRLIYLSTCVSTSS